MMSITSLGARALIGAAICALTVAADVGINAANGVPWTPRRVGLESLIFCFYLGWLGLGELRRVGKDVRTFQVTIAGLGVPMFFFTSGQSRQLVLLVIAVVMLATFALGMRYRRTGNGGGR